MQTDEGDGPTRHKVLQGSLVLLGALVLGPIVSWKLLLLLWPARWTLLATWVAAEACFYWVYYKPLYARHNRIPSPCAPRGFTDSEGRRQWGRFMAVTRALPGRVDAKEYLQQWFCDAPLESIRQENVREMLTYGFFYKTREELTPELDAFTHQMVRELGESLNIRFEPGYTPRLTQQGPLKARTQRPRTSTGLDFMDHLWDDLRAQPRPLVKYLFFEGLYFAQRLIMAGYGFQHRRMGQLGYYTLGCGLDAAAYSKRRHTSSGSNGGSNGGSSSSSSLSSWLDRWLDWVLDQLMRPADAPSSATAAGGGGVESVASVVSADSDDYTPFADPLAVEAADHLSTLPPPVFNPLSEALPKGQDSTTPVLFLHGVGGLMLYLELLKHVIGLGHPVVVVEYKHVGLRLSSAIPDVDTLTRNVVDILDAEAISKVCVVGHSYGSFLASRLNMCYSERVHSLCVIDPVALGMFMPHLLHNFMYRSPRVNLRRPDILARDLVLAFASRDMHLAAAFQRNFYWTEMNMWPQDLPPGSCVILSEDDDLCNAEGVEEMCRLAPHVKVIRNSDLFHGAFLFSTTHKASFVAEVRNLLATSGSLVVHMARPVLEKTITATRSLLHGVETLTSRLSMSPQPFGAGGGLEQRPSIWQTMSSFKARKRSSVPIPDPDSNASSTSATPMPPRSGSAPLHDTTAAAAAAAVAAGSSNGSPPGAPAAAGWWGAAAAAAAAQCDQQPGAAGVQGLRGQQQQQPKQLSMILSGPEGTMASELGQAPGGSGGSSRLGGSSSTAQDSLVEDDWVLTDQNNGSSGAGAGGGGEGVGLLGAPLNQAGVYRNVLGAIQEDASEQHQQQQQREPSLPNCHKSPAAAAAAAAAGAKAGAAAAPAGSADAVAVEDQSP